MFENWIEREPRQVRNDGSKNVVKFSFARNHRGTATPYGTLYIGEDVLKASNINPEDRVSIFSNPEDARQFLVKKTTPGNGYKLSKIGKKGSTSLVRVSFSAWIDEKKILEKDYKMRAVKYEVTDGGILVDTNHPNA